MRRNLRDGAAPRDLGKGFGGGVPRAPLRFLSAVEEEVDAEAAAAASAAEEAAARAAEEATAMEPIWAVDAPAQRAPARSDASSLLAPLVRRAQLVGAWVSRGGAWAASVLRAAAAPLHRASMGAAAAPLPAAAADAAPDGPREGGSAEGRALRPQAV